MTEPRPLGSATLVRLVAAREISARLRDKNFIISSAVIIVILVGVGTQSTGVAMGIR